MNRILLFFNNIKLRNKLILTYLLTSIVPITILGALCYRQTSALLLERESYKQEESMQQVASSLSNQIEIYNNLSDYIAFNKTIEQVLNYDYQDYYDMYEKYTNLLDPMLSSLKYFHNDVKRVTIYSDYATIEHDTTIAPLEEVKNTSWCRKVMEEGGVRWFVTETGSAFFVRQLPKNTGSEVSGVLLIDVSYEKLFEPLSNLVDENYGICVMDEDNRPIFEDWSFDKKYQGEILSADQLAVIEEEGEAGVNAAYKITTSTIESSGWKLYLYKPMDVISKAAGSIAATVVFFVLLSLLLVLGVGYAMSYLVGHRLVQLRREMRQVEEGNMNVTLTSDARDEIGELIRSYGRMISQLQFLIDEVYQGEIKLKKFEMKALQAQINPHFLYNTLSAINWKAIAAGEKEISRMTLLLSDFYRTTLNKGKNALLVSDELKNMDSYLEIQLIMHDNSFDVEREIDPRILHHMMPNLMLQPIVENAIAHGIDELEERRGKLKISGIQKENSFEFRIEDNGIGIEEETLQKILTIHSHGYGVKNVHERIGVLYGAEYGLVIESIVGEGTIVKMELPNEMKPESGSYREGQGRTNEKTTSG